MSQNTFYSQSPVVKTQRLKLAERFFIEEIKTPFFISFDKDVSWLKSSVARISYWHEEIFFEKGNEYTDYYGLFTSTVSAIEEAQKLAQNFKINQSSSFEIRVISEITLTPVVAVNDNYDDKYKYKSLDNSKWFYDNSDIINEYINVMKNLKDGDYDTRFSIHDKLMTQELRSKVLAQDVVLWSSKTNKDQFRQQFINFYTNTNQE